MSYREDYLFWNIVNELMGTKNYRLITMTNDQNEIWLENDHNSQYPLVRLMRYDLNWANTLKNDLNRTAVNGENIRKKLFKKPVSVLNVYITQFKPVDDFEFIDKEIKNNKTSITSMLLDSLSLSEELGRMEQKVSIPLEHLANIPEEVEEEQVTALKKQALAAAVQKRQEDQQVFSNGKPFFF